MGNGGSSTCNGRGWNTWEVSFGVPGRGLEYLGEVVGVPRQKAVSGIG